MVSPASFPHPLQPSFICAANLFLFTRGETEGGGNTLVSRHTVAHWPLRGGGLREILGVPGGVENPRRRKSLLVHII